MKHFSISVQHWHAVCMAMLLLGALWSHARTPIFAERDNFTAYVSGYNKVHFKLPLYDCNNIDRWADEIQIYANGHIILAFSTTEDDYNICRAETFNSGKDRFQIYTTSGYQYVAYSKTAYQVPTPAYKATDASYVEFEWYAPSDFSGECNIEIKGQYKWWGDHFALGSEDKNRTALFSILKPVFSKSDAPEITTIVPSYAANRQGTMTAVWYVPTNGLISARWKEDGKDWEAINGKDPNGEIYLDAFKPHNNVKVETTYKTQNGYSTTVVSAPVSSKMIHRPTSFTAETNTDKVAVTLKWKVENPTESDYYDTDIWEVQRNVSGDASNENEWKFIGTVDYVNNKRDTTYQFCDEEIFNAYKGVNKVYYRIRRTNTALWGWEENSGYASVLLDYYPRFSTVANLCANLSDKSGNILTEDKVSPQQPVDMDKYGYVKLRWALYGADYSPWTKDFKVSLVTKYYNANGELAGTSTRELTESELRKEEMLVQLTRPCVEYQFELDEQSLRKDVPLYHLLLGNYDYEGDDYHRVFKMQQPNFEQKYVKYKIEHIGAPANLKVTNKHTYTQLTWEQDDYECDYYRVYRRPYKSEDNFELIKDNLSLRFYDDKNVSPVETYEYYIEAVTQCEGIKVKKSDIVVGNIDRTGTVDGYVRMPDGSAIVGARVTATPAGDIPMAQSKTVVTDSLGYYSISGLVYQTAKGMAGSYNITIESTDGAKYIAPIDQAMFNRNTNYVSGIIFTLSQSYKFSGAVYYEDSSIPVAGAMFKIDDQVVYNNNGKPITTDNSGEFSLIVSPGTHSVRVFKENHQFADDGLLIDLDATDGDTQRHNFQKDLTGYYFWDKTKIRVKGRIAGGNDEGVKPLGQWQSKNILGDNLEMVLQLDGDNSSYIYRDNANTALTQKVEDHTETVDDVDHKWRVTRERHRIVVHPDSLTGEFLVDLYPVKWKMTQASCNGYVTLIQSGKANEIYDLTDSVGTAVINYVYHSNVDFEISQMGQNNTFPYFGQLQYNSLDVSGNSYPVPLAYKGKNDTKTSYTFGHPVFMESNPYYFTIKAGEYYYYNNNHNLLPTVVPIKNASVIIHNQLVSGDDATVVDMDTLGVANYIFTPENVTYTSVGDEALRSITFTLDYKGAHYDTEPIRAFLMGARNIPQGHRFVAADVPMLFDILRDPPGSNSSATLSKGSKLSSSFNYKISGQVGVGLEFVTKSGQNLITGSWQGVAPAGTITATPVSVKKSSYASLSLALSGGYEPSYEYEYSVDEDISTSSNWKWVGSAADVYMGFNNQISVEEANAVRAVPKSLYDHISKAGVMVIATDTVPSSALNEGQDSVYYLIKDNVMTINDAPGAFFYYTQNYIETQLLPDLYKQRNALLIPKNAGEEYAQSVANTTQKPTYYSLKDENEDGYAGYSVVDGKTVKNWKRFTPSGWTGSPVDDVERLNTIAFAWLGYLVQNEKEKIEATDLVKRFDFDGLTSVSYSESFSSSYSDSRYLTYPGLGSSGEIGDFLEGELAGSAIGSFFKSLFSKNNAANGGGDDQNGNNNGNVIDVEAGSSGFQITITPILEINTSSSYGQDESHSKSINISFDASEKSNLTVDVYRVKHTIGTDSLKALAARGEAYASFSKNTLDKVSSNAVGSVNLLDNIKDLVEYGSFVYRTRGGMTRDPWEEKEVTKYYMPGTVINEPTIQLDRLRLWADKQEVSNVPMGEPARFTIHMRNDGNYPERSGKFFYLASNVTLDMKGAKIMCEGAPLIEPLCVELDPGQTVTKIIEVYPAEASDYDNLGLWLYSEEDLRHCQDLTLAAHFVPSAGKVNISSPGDKWVLNTFAQYDEDRADHYMPVRIDGFDTNFRGFDHIELQYKKSNEGDKEWVSLCSYFADEEKMAMASGTKKLIGSDGVIMERFYGDKGAVEQKYDIRAVEYCSYGSGFLTGSSNIISGTKDTRYPTLFGTPEPKNSVLGIGDYIRIPFSENIDANSLSKINNFQVTGRTNNSNIVLSTSLNFSNKFLAISEFERNLAQKDFSIDLMINPVFNGTDMCFFSHGNSMSYLNMYVTANKHLKVVMKTTERLDSLTSKDAIDFNGLHQVAMTYDMTSSTLKLYDGNKEIGHKSFDGVYVGRGSLVFGAKYILSDDGGFISMPTNFYNGNMLEFRLWNKVLTPADITDYSHINLTGYEYGLLDNYPMNEGTGSICEDKGPGRNNILLGGTGHFTQPKGISIKLTDGVAINGRPFYSSEHEDFTFMMWFKTTSSNGTIIANGEATTESDKYNHFNIGVADGELYYRHGGMALKNLSYVSDGAWHHVAVTENNTRNVGNIYVDGSLKDTYAVDTIGGFSYNDMMLGACLSTDGRVTDKLECNVDEVGLFSMVLPENVIKKYMAQTPNGQEMGLRGWLSCSTYERQNNNIVRIMPSGVSLKVYKADGIIQQQRDTIISADVMASIADRTDYASMNDSEPIDNLDFTYVVKDNELVINLGESEEKLERTNVYVTVKEVADLCGNLLQSPVMMDLYVYRAPLRWKVKQQRVTSHYLEGTTFTIDIENVSGKARNYELRGLPSWLTASQMSGTLAALGEQTITFTVNKNTNIGNYDELLYVCDEGGINEPLPLSVSVVCDAPDWTVSDDYARGLSMQIVVRVKKQNNVMHDSNDLLAVSDSLGQFMGVNHINVDNINNANEALTYLTLHTDHVYGTNSQNRYSTPLNFWFFDSSTGRIYIAKADSELVFQPNVTLGTPTNPVVLTVSTYEQVQPVKLQKGWNWVSFYVNPSFNPSTFLSESVNVSQFLNKVGKWRSGDAFSYIERGNSEADAKALIYTSEQITPIEKVEFWSDTHLESVISGSKKYDIYVTSPRIIYVPGVRDYTPVTARVGWNRIAYNMPYNMTVENAMADYLDDANDGDVLKSHDAFAMVCIDANGNKTWKGNLHYMTSGQGYMLKRNAGNVGDSVQFYYPMNTEYYQETNNDMTASNAYSHVYGPNNMNLVAQAVGVEVEEGDSLLARCGGALRGVAVADAESRFYLTVGSDADHAVYSTDMLEFALLRNGEIISVAKTMLPYQTNTILGNPASPAQLEFGEPSGTADSSWYDLNGIRHKHVPQQRGIYIHGGKKQVIKANK